jgi:hypothetical protein
VTGVGLGREREERMEDLETLRTFYEELMFHLPQAEQAGEEEIEGEHSGNSETKSEDDREEKAEIRGARFFRKKPNALAAKIRPGFEGASIARKRVEK